MTSTLLYAPPAATGAVRIGCLLATLGLWLALPVAAVRLPFRHYLTTDGLPQSQVLALYQDHRGELWVGTWSGAARFDGADFRALSQRSGLPSHFIFDILADADGDLWLAAGPNLARLDSDDRSHIAEAFDPLFPGAGGSWVRDLYLDRQQTLWLATQRDGLAYRRGRSLEPVAAPDLVADVLQIFAETSGGELLVGTSRGIYAVIDAAARPWRTDPGPWSRPISVLLAADEALWILNDVGLFRVKGDTVTEIAVADEPIRGGRSLLVDRRGQLWIAADSGLYRMVGERVVRLGVREGLHSEGRYYALYEDRDGDLWIGSDAGLALFPGDTFRIYLEADGLEAEGIWSLATASDERLWIGTDDGVFWFVDEQIERLPEPNPLRGRQVRAIVADAQGGVWFGTGNSGLFERHPEQGWRQYLPPDLPGARVYAAYRDQRDALWFSTRQGLVRHHEGELTTWTAAEGLPDDHVWKVIEEPGGRLVAATTRGLAWLEGERFVVPSRFMPMLGVPVRGLAVRREQELWVGTDGHGLFVLEGEEWRHFPGGSGPADDFNWGLIEDRRAQIWSASNHGLDVYDGEHWRNFSRQDGLLEDELNLNSALATEDGSVWFGFSNKAGLVRFSDDLQSGIDDPPVVHLNAITTLSRRLTNEPFAVELAWSERDVTFSYIAMSLRDNDSVIYRSMLEGYDNDYGSPSSERSVRYTNLAPGLYTFKVQAARADGPWARTPATATVEILAPFWRTWWFYLAASLAAGLAIYAGLRLRWRHVEIERRHLEDCVARRTRELETEKRRAEVALAKVKTLSGLLPICSSCKAIRDDQGYWNRIEEYVCKYSNAEFSHGLCPSCLDEMYGSFLEESEPVAETNLS